MATETHTASNVKIAKLRDEVESLRLEKEEWKKAYFETSASWVKSQKEGTAEILRLKKELHAVREDRNNQTAEILDRLQDMMDSPVNSSGSSAHLLTLAESALFEELTANYGCSQPLAAHFVAAHVSTDNLRSIRTGREYRQDGPTPHGTEWCDTCTELDT